MSLRIKTKLVQISEFLHDGRWLPVISDGCFLFFDYAYIAFPVRLLISLTIIGNDKIESKYSKPQPQGLLCLRCFF